MRYKRWDGVGLNAASTSRASSRHAISCVFRVEYVPPPHRTAVMKAFQWTRRAWLAAMAPLLAPLGVNAQGVASRGVKATPRGKPSGIPFLAHFTDIAFEAGLRVPTIYGPADHKDYILETIGWGGEFFDYDNDG